MPRHSVEAVIDRDEDRGLALAGQGRGQIGAPHLVDPLGSDRAVVGLRAMRPADPAWRLQTMLARQAQDAALGGADAGEAQPCPDLPVALTVERALGQQLADRLDQRLVGHRPERARPAPRAWFVASAMTIQRGPRCAPDPGHPQDPVRPVGGGRDLAAHGLDLRRAKGRPRLQALDLGLEQLVGHGQVTDLGLEAADLEVTAIGWPGLQRRLARRQEGVAPSAQLRRRHPQLPRHQLQILAAQQPQHRALLALGRHPPAPLRRWPVSASVLGALRRASAPCRRVRHAHLLALPH